MNLNELNINEGIHLPSLMSPKGKSPFTYHQKSEHNVKYKIKTDLRVNFLTRYNKKFWESCNNENHMISYNQLNKDKKLIDPRYKSQNFKKTTELDLIEIHDFDDRMKNELENIDRWIFNNLKKMSLPDNVSRSKGDAGNMTMNIDLQMLNFIISTSTQPIEGFNTNNRNKKKVIEPNPSKELQSKIAVTSETLNNEHNKAILIELIRKKIINHDEYNKKDATYNIMLAKMIATDLIASFKTLNVFRHQNVLRLKEVLESIYDNMQSARVTIINSVRSDAAEDYLFYEKTLKKNLRECEDEIQSRKDTSKKMLDTIRQKKTSINTERQRLFDFIKMLEEKENETGRNRKIGEKMKLREYMEINEYKSKRIKLEAGINMFVKVSNKEIEEMNQRIYTFDKEIEDYKFKRTWFIFKLKEYYMDFLMSENLLIKINKNVVSIIKSIWTLNEEVFISSFSKFYEKEDVLFALKYAKVHNEFLSARADNNSMKNEIKDALKKNYDEIINEDEYEIIGNFKDSLKKFKSDALKLYERKKVRTSKRSYIYKYFEITPETNPIDKNTITNTKTRNRIDTDNFSSALSQLSEVLSQLKEQHIQILLKRTIEKNNRSKLLGYANSEYLKKVLRLLFGYHEMQIILQKLLKNNQIQIVPI